MNFNTSTNIIVFFSAGKPDGLYLLYKSNFKFNSSETKNLHLKWLGVFFNFDYVTGSVELFLNGNKAEESRNKKIIFPKDAGQKPLILRIGKYFLDGTPLIGKIVDINIWDRSVNFK